jgi:hypothetical protein
MQARFVSLRVTETWEMVEGRSTASSASPSEAQIGDETVDAERHSLLRAADDPRPGPTDPPQS